MRKHLSYYQRVLQAVEWIQDGAVATAYVPVRSGEGYTEIRRADGGRLSITHKMWNKVNNKIGSRLEMTNHVEGVFASFKYVTQTGVGA